MSLIKAKCDEYMVSLELVDPQNQFEKTTMKHCKIVEVVT